MQTKRDQTAEMHAQIAKTERSDSKNAWSRSAGKAGQPSLYSLRFIIVSLPVKFMAGAVGSFSSPDLLSVPTLIQSPFHPRGTTAAHKRPWSFCQKCSWQVTSKHSHTPLTLRSWSGDRLTMPLRYSVGTCQGKQAHTQLISAQWATADWSWPTQWNWWALSDLDTDKNAGRNSPKSFYARGKKNWQTNIYKKKPKKSETELTASILKKNGNKTKQCNAKG